VQLALDDGRIESARIALGSAGLTPVRARAAEDELTGRAPDDAVVDKAATAAAAAADPVGDQRGSPAFKRRLIAALVQRAVHIALRRAAGETVKNSHEYY
jgi:carbon-monoxide dehydrogenase medium subunit